MQVAIEEQQELAKYVAEALAGEPVVLTEDGRTVARIVPHETLVSKEEHAAAVERLMVLLNEGFDLGGVRIHDRDELYDRGL